MVDNKNTTERNDRETPGSCAAGEWYEIRVQGQLDESWSDWLEGLAVELQENGEMVLRGRLADQSSLMGILVRLHGLNLALLSLGKVGQKYSNPINHLKEE